ncbi:hypothetical protein [Actinokineospora iranica]|uniref:Integral membrane protein n=1 Tax=Actinokineospora iranica TaxID=1271860 RepID=A0A1G6SPV5_9PSEU|nr:hypothetical protein [Actinokineospora iranica]SDD18247.1 hypothetical protein SAMN05216174_10875 [Actinokineospora iranica]
MTTTAHGASRLSDSSAAATPAVTLLRRFLALDAVVTTGNGLLYLAFSTWAGDLLGVSPTALVGIGAFLTVFGLGVAALAMSKNPARGGTTFVIDANFLWAAASVVVALFGLMGANTIGTVWTIMQAGTVAGFAALQLFALTKLKSAE